MNIIKKTGIVILWASFVLLACGKDSGDNDNTNGNGNGGDGGGSEPTALAERNVQRAMDLVDKAIANHFTGDGMAMARFYNPYTNVRSDEKGSVWMYTSSIEAVNAILHSLKAHKEHGNADLYNKHFTRYSELLSKLYTNAGYYKGTFTLTSYTQTKQWSVYGVNRSGGIGSANVEGRENVYDDQQWLIRELIEAYKLTNNTAYLTEAEYLTDYVLDGWDCALDSNGKEYGGITWGPGYTTKHACSNGPMVSPLVWLYELYNGKNDEISYRYIDTDNSRKTASMKKSEYYLKFAKAVYDWQKTNMLRTDGVYYDMLGGCDPNCDVAYETVNGIKYRKHTNLRDKVDPPYSYNCGTMLSGAADLYRVTQNNTYLDDAKKLADASSKYFARLGATVPGYYTYDINGFSTWFNGVLMRGYVDVSPSYNNVTTAINSFQKNLDYGHSKFLYNGVLPVNLLLGWSRDNNNNGIEGMFTFTYAAEYAVLARYELEKDK